MKNVEFMENLLKPYYPQLPIDQLVIEMNKIFHSFDANYYDTKHPEIYEQLSPIWKEMSKKVTESIESNALRILDFGCGTGFEASQLLQNIPASSIAVLTYYDPSPEMLEKCRKNVAPFFPDALFCSSLDEEALTTNAPYTLLVTNSVLHHLPDVPSTIRNLLPSLDSNAIWLAGHEPSLRFYKNTECVKNLEAFLEEKRWSLSNYSQLLKLIVRRLVKGNIYVKAGREAVRTGLFLQQPPVPIIDRLIDFHVAHSTEEISVGRGFDYSALLTMGDTLNFQPSWRLVWLKTYSFMGPFYEGRLKGRWVRKCHELACRFPNDGANFCMILQRV